MGDIFLSGSQLFIVTSSTAIQQSESLAFISTASTGVTDDPAADFLAILFTAEDAFLMFAILGGNTCGY